MTLTESPRSLLKPIASRTSAVILSISSAPSGTLRRLALGVGDAAVVDDDGGVQPLDVPVALRVTRTVLSTS